MAGNYSRPFSFVPATRRKPRKPHEQALYEYACQEGNTAIRLLLGGARADEAQAAKAKKE